MGETRGSGKWGQPGVPHKGWSCVGIEDLEEPSAVCDMCETQEIRYVHYMEHPGYPDQLGVGCICAGHMEQDYEGALRREQSLKASARRRARWLERTWRRSAAGNRYLNVEGYNVVAYERGRDAIGPVWGFSITNRKTGSRAASKRPYRTEDQARQASFDALIWMKERASPP